MSSRGGGGRGRGRGEELPGWQEGGRGRGGGGGGRGWGRGRGEEFPGRQEGGRGRGGGGGGGSGGRAGGDGYAVGGGRGEEFPGRQEGGRGRGGGGGGRARGEGYAVGGGRGGAHAWKIPAGGRGGASVEGGGDGARHPGLGRARAGGEADVAAAEVEKMAIAGAREGPSSSAPAPAPAPAVVAPISRLPPASSQALVLPPRPGFGTAGRPCRVRANHFLAQVADKELYHYDVAIKPESISRERNRSIINEIVRLHKQSLDGRLPIYDGRKSIYTAGPLPFQTKEFVVKLANPVKGNQREEEYKVTIKHASKLDLYHLRQFLAGRQRELPQDTIQALDIALRESPTAKYVPISRSFFSQSFGHSGDIGSGVECWRGYYQSLRPTQMGLSLNIDVSATAFYKAQPVVDFVCEYLNIRDPSRRLSEQDRLKLKKALKGVRVVATHRTDKSIRYKITGIPSVPLKELMFDRDGSSILEGQRYSRKLNEHQVTSILRMACERPAQRESSILEIVNRNDYGNEHYSNEFGIGVTNQLALVNARVLPAPRLKYHDSGREKVCNPSIGQWNMNNKRLVNGGSIRHWACLTFASRLHPKDIGMFCTDLASVCNNFGMQVNMRPCIDIRQGRQENVEAAIRTIHRQSSEVLAQQGPTKEQLELLIIILPDLGGFYGRIKRLCETEIGVVTQCCAPRNVQKGGRQYLENLALKINVKVGGRNTVLDDALHKRIPLLTDLPTIIFGADVTHPSPGEDASPSIAAVVASMDWPEVSKYKCLVSSQGHREEIIADLFTEVNDPKNGVVRGGMISELLRSFHRATGCKPRRIIFYRDGVSEGQFSQVLLYEMDAIRKACASIEEGYLPPVTFVVVQKRHHTRLFPENHRARDLTDRSGNILPGTVVDTTICHPSEFDFYLCSHAGIQGTSRPTHCHVLFDENGFSSDALQILTYNLCYTYARCTRSVSIVPPAYYAHLAAFRARHYMDDDQSDQGSSSAASSRTREQSAPTKQLPKIKENVKELMFYC